MSKLPQLNLRIAEDYHQLIRDIAARLRESTAPAFAHELDAFLIGHPNPPPMATSPVELLKRLDELEETVGKLAMMMTAQAMAAPVEIPAKLNAAYPDELLAQANDLNNQGMTWEAVWKHLGEPGTVNGLRNAVGKRRRRAA